MAEERSTSTYVTEAQSYTWCVTGHTKTTQKYNIEGSTKSARYVKLVHHSKEGSQSYRNFFLEILPKNVNYVGGGRYLLLKAFKVSMIKAKNVLPSLWESCCGLEAHIQGSLKVPQFPERFPKSKFSFCKVPYDSLYSVQFVYSFNFKEFE